MADATATKAPPLVSPPLPEPTLTAGISPEPEIASTAESPARRVAAEDAAAVLEVRPAPADHEADPAEFSRDAEVESDEAVDAIDSALTDTADIEAALVLPAPVETESPEPESIETEFVLETEPVETLFVDTESVDAILPAPGTAQAGAPDITATSAEAPSALILRDLVVTFGDLTAVNKVSLSVPAGSFYGIVGPNGAGKTTILSTVAGLLVADSGDVIVDGINQRSDPLAAKRAIGVLPDRLRTFDRLTGRQLLHYYGVLRGLTSRVIDARMHDLARAFDLTDALGRVVSDYSTGMTKKIMLAGAMIHSPRVLVLDEPFEAVDPGSSAVILDILRVYVENGGTVILSSHGMDLIERVSSRVAVIVGGDLLAEGSLTEVRAGKSLEERFIELSAVSREVEGLEWLHVFSG